jgi:replicative DNA helicase
MSEPVADLGMERQVLGALMMVTDARVQAIQVDTGLLPDHFYFDKHRAILASIYRVAEVADPDELLVIADLKEAGELEAIGGSNYVSVLCQEVLAPGNVFHHTKRVIEAAEWRQKQQAGTLIGEAVQDRDRAKLAEAEGILAQEVVAAGATFAPGQLDQVAHEILTGEPQEAFPWPLNPLNKLTAGGIRRGEFVVVGGHTSHGKSVFLDQTLTSLTRSGRRVHLYMNEMSVRERVARSLARVTGIPYAKLVQGKLTDEERAFAAKRQRQATAYGITECAGWSAEQISHHIRRNRWDIAAVDILHLIPYQETKDLEAIAAVFARTALQADCALIATVHLNRGRIKTAKVPRPTNADIKGASAFEQNANTVCFVHRNQNDSGIPVPSGRIYFTKVRNGELGEAKVRLNGERYRFESDDLPPIQTPPDEPLPEEPAPREDPLPF